MSHGSTPWRISLQGVFAFTKCCVKNEKKTPFRGSMGFRMGFRILTSERCCVIIFIGVIEMTINELAKDLCTSRENVLFWASDYNQTNSHIDGEYIPRHIENYIRTKHLKATHPELFRRLNEFYPADLAYERWVVMLDRKIKGGA